MISFERGFTYFAIATSTNDNGRGCQGKTRPTNSVASRVLADNQFRFRVEPIYMPTNQYSTTVH